MNEDPFTEALIRNRDKVQFASSLSFGKIVSISEVTGNVPAATTVALDIDADLPSGGYAIGWAQFVDKNEYFYPYWDMSVNSADSSYADPDGLTEYGTLLVGIKENSIRAFFYNADSEASDLLMKLWILAP